ncbi:phosphofructokinase [Dunaliella salina]|nr:phosphofructokinase [Dunaliella salina]|eukprot:KAF5839848.1 phosphofructokinase [Dunaliella salina]
MDHTFGFQTAVEEAQRSLLAAKVEATSGLRGIGLVKLMGRQSGFIAMQASLASGLVDICLIPEEPFDLEGDHGLLAYIERVMAYKGHCVLCCAEGAGQNLLQPQDGSPRELDPSGNVKLKDIGIFLKHKIRQHFATSPTAGGPVDLKLIDPTYMIRTIESGQQDSIYCKVLAHSAVDAAFAGYTGICVAQVNTHFAMLPIPVITKYPRRVDPLGKPWTRLKADVQQPPLHK